MLGWYHSAQRLLASAGRAATPTPLRRRATFRPTVEGLEDRQVPSGVSLSHPLEVAGSPAQLLVAAKRGHKPRAVRHQCAAYSAGELDVDIINGKLQQGVGVPGIVSWVDPKTGVRVNHGVTVTWTGTNDFPRSVSIIQNRPGPFNHPHNGLKLKIPGLHDASHGGAIRVILTGCDEYVPLVLPPPPGPILYG
jgi:hypothetical protein